MCQFSVLFFFLTVVFYFYLSLAFFAYFGCAGSSLLCGLLCGCGEQGLLSGCGAGASLVGRGLWDMGCGSHCGRTQWLQTEGSRALAQHLECMGLVASWRVGSSLTQTTPVSPGLVGGFFITELLGKPPCCFDYCGFVV